jgi:hypothetical protein
MSPNIMEKMVMMDPKSIVDSFLSDGHG